MTERTGLLYTHGIRVLPIDAAPAESGGTAAGDYDGDGDFDWFVSSIRNPNGIAESNWFTSSNHLYRNRADGSFENVTDTAGVREGFWG